MEQGRPRRDEQNHEWPLPLPEAAQALVPAADADTKAALRRTCRALRRVVDESIHSITLSGTLYHLVGVHQALPRLSGLWDLQLNEGTDGSIAAFATLALPRVPQLTSLKISMAGEQEEEEEEDEEDDATAAPVAPHGGMLLGLHLNALQRLEKFVGPFRRHAWGLSAVGIAAALAQLPALRELKLHCDITAEMLFGEPCEMLGADAWQSLEALDVKGWTVEGVKALAQTPLPRLTHLYMYSPTCEPSDDSLCAILSAAPWAAQLDFLTLQITYDTPLEMLTGLQLPNLTELRLFGDDTMQEHVQELMPTDAWHLPKLQALRVDCRLLCDPAASLAGLQLPSLISLGLVGPSLYASDLSALLHRTPWVADVELFDIWAPTNGMGIKAWAAALASAPLPKLRVLCVYTDSGINEAAALLGDAPWLRGLALLDLPQLGDEAVAAMRAGKGGFAELEATGRVMYHTPWPDE